MQSYESKIILKLDFIMIIERNNMTKTRLIDIQKAAKKVFSVDNRIQKAFVLDPKDCLWSRKNYLEIVIDTNDSPLSFNELSDLSAEMEKILETDIIIFSSRQSGLSENRLLVYDRQNKGNDYLLLAKKHLKSAVYLFDKASENEEALFLYNCIGIWIKTSIECIFRHFLFKAGIILEPISYDLEYLYNLTDKTTIDYCLPESLKTKIHLLDGFEEDKWQISYPEITREELQKLINDTDNYLKLIEKKDDNE